MKPEVDIHLDRRGRYIWRQADGLAECIFLPFQSENGAVTEGIAANLTTELIMDAGHVVKTFLGLGVVQVKSLASVRREMCNVCAEACRRRRGAT